MREDRLQQAEDRIAELMATVAGIQALMLQASQHECDTRPTCACCGVRTRIGTPLAPYAGIVCSTCSSQPEGRALLDAARGYEIAEGPCPQS